MPRAGLTPATVVDEAGRVADEVGLDRLTLSDLAQRLGVAVPSLYKHVRGLEALRQQLAIAALGELTAAMSAAAVGRSGEQALHALAHAYRRYAREHPGRYAATVRAPDPDNTKHAAAATTAVEVLFAVLAGYGLTNDGAVDAARFLRSALHGFVVLEDADGFGLPDSIEVSYDRLIDALHGALSAWPAASSVDQ
jgi:AcrR family transcriptional regulator